MEIPRRRDAETPWMAGDSFGVVSFCVTHLVPFLSHLFLLFVPYLQMSTRVENLPVCLRTYVPICLPASLPPCLPASLPPYLPTPSLPTLPTTVNQINRNAMYHSE